MFLDVLSGAAIAVVFIFGILLAGFILAAVNNSKTIKRKKNTLSDIDRKTQQANQFNRAEHERLTNDGK